MIGSRVPALPFPVLGGTLRTDPLPEALDTISLMLTILEGLWEGQWAWKQPGTPQVLNSFICHQGGPYKPRIRRDVECQGLTLGSLLSSCGGIYSLRPCFLCPERISEVLETSTLELLLGSLFPSVRSKQQTQSLCL